MAFIYEVIPENDRELVLSMGFKDFTGYRPLLISSRARWCADRERNAFLKGIGGGMRDIPLFFDLWWNGEVVHIEVNDLGSEGNMNDGYDLNWNILKIIIPEFLWNKKDEILDMINEAFSINNAGIETKYVNSINVNIRCMPECL